MPDIELDFSHQHPDVNDLVANGVKAILFYSRVSTPPRRYIESVVAAGIGALPIFETDPTRSFLGLTPAVTTPLRPPATSVASVCPRACVSTSTWPTRRMCGATKI